MIEQGALTSWRPHRRGQVKKQNEYDRAVGTHFLETASGGISQDTECMRPRKGYSQPEDRVVRGKPGHRKSVTESAALTSWRPHREERVRTWIECDGRKGYSRPEERIGRDESVHSKNATERGALTHCRPYRKG